MRKSSRVFIYVFCVLNSISGLQIAGISLNTIFVGLFAVFIACGCVTNGKREIRIKKRDYFAVYIICAILSCAFSMFYTYRLPHVSIVSNYLLNCIIYLMIFVLLRNCREGYKNELSKMFMNGLIYAARI